MKNPDTTPEELASQVRVKLLDPLGKGIEGLKYQIREGQKIVAKGVTDGKGQITSFASRIGAELTVHVERFASEEMKHIKTLYPWNDNFKVKVVSGKVKEEIPLAKSKGAPGQYQRKTHKVKKGETLGKIAIEHHTSAEILAQLNGIKLESIIHIDQVLKLPLEKNGAGVRAEASPAGSPAPAPVHSPAPVPAHAPTPPHMPAPAPARVPPPTAGQNPGPAKVPPHPVPPVQSPATKAPAAPPAPVQPSAPAPNGVPISGPVPTKKVDDRGENGTPKATVNMQCDQTGCIKLGDTGPIVEEINIRLLGFVGYVGHPAPFSKFTAATEAAVKQFQRDYMGVAETGKVCGAVIRAIDQFRLEYTLNVNEMKCPCGICGGFGTGLLDSATTSLRKNNHVINGVEHPGIHRGIIWIGRAALFYINKTDKALGYSWHAIASGFRCWKRNQQKNRATVNHMGLALDLQYKKGSATTRCEGNDIDNLRRDVFIKRLGAKLGARVPNRAWLEPRVFGNGDTGATSWVHVDITSFTQQYMESRFFVKTNDAANGPTLMSMVEQESRFGLKNCGGIPPKLPAVSTDRLPIASLKPSGKLVDFLIGWEKFEKRVYNDSAKNCTIGIGHLIGYKKCEELAAERHPEYEKYKNVVLTEKEARALLADDMADAVAQIQVAVKVPMYQYEYDALLSLIFNAGNPKKFPKLFKKLNGSQYSQCTEEFSDITSGGDRGLVKRRKSEVNMFLHNIYDSTH